MDPGQWNNTFSQIQRKGVLLNENILKENFQDVVNKAFDKEMGFGYVSENGYKPRARVILQGKNPFLDNHMGLLSPVLEGYLPYSQVYHLAWGGAGTTYCILRHHLHLPSLSGEELDSIKVATCSMENVNSMDNKVSRFEEANGFTERKVSVTEKKISTTVTSVVMTQERKQSVTVTENGNHTGKNPLKKKSTQLLLEQMNQIVRPIANAAATGFVPGQVVLTVHKAKEIAKKGLVGKADPYVVLSYGSQKEKSTTANNDHNPVWHVTGYFDVVEQSSNEITIEVFDDDIGKDDFLGKAIINIKEICESKEFINHWIPLTNCKSGEILISAKFIPLRKIKRSVGHLSLTLHKAKKIEKKNLIKKADPYVLIKLGADKHKTKTVNNSHNPSWNYVVEFDIIEASPRQISFEVFDDDIGNDATLGNLTFDLDTLMQKNKIDNLWNPLENCKSGQLLISAIFTPSPVVEEIEDDINENVVDIEKQVITEHFEENVSHTESMAEPSSVANAITHENQHNYSIEFVDPLYVDDQFIVVEKKANNWFMIVSQHQNLPINVNLVPFKQASDKSCPIFIYPLPNGGFHNIKRVVHSGKGLKKCGYEKPCVLRAGEAYQFWTDTQGKNFNLGNLKTETFGPDRSWVVYKPEYFESQDFIEATLKISDNAEPVFSGPISLYDTLNVEAA